MGAAALALGAWAAPGRIATHAGPGGGAGRHHERGGPPSSRIATCPKPPWATSWPRPSALATTTASSWRPTWAGSPWATSTTRSPPPGPQRRRDRRRPPPPRRSAAGPGEVLDGAGPQAPPGRRYGRRRGPGLDGLALVGRYLLLAIEGGLPLGDVKGPDAAGPRAGPGRRRGNPHRRRTGWTGRRFPGGPCAIPQVGPVARRSGPPLWSSTSHFKGKWDTSAPGLAGDTRTMKTDKKGALRLQTHLLLDRPAIDWPCRT